MYITIYIWYNIGYTMVHSKGFNRKHDHTRVAHDALEDPDFDGDRWKCLEGPPASAHVCPNEIHPSFFIKHHCLALQYPQSCWL